MNKSDVEALIDRLAREVRCDCPSDIICDCYFHTILHVRIGDVLAKLQLYHAGINGWNPLMNELVELWAKCGFNNSLQDIAKKSGYEYSECIDLSCKCGKFPLRNDECDFKIQLKDPNARALFEFIDSVLPNSQVTNNQ